MKNPLKPGFGARLRAERERLGHTQKDFAESAGVKRVTQYFYEHEDNSPNLRYLTAIAGLGVDVYYLFFDKRRGNENVDHHPDLLSNIFIVVDKFARDEKGKPLSLEARLDFYNVLCSKYAGTQERNVDIGSVLTTLKKSVSNY